VHRSSSGVIGLIVVLSTFMAVYGEDKEVPPAADRIVWGNEVNGLQLGISPNVGANGLPATLFDGGTLTVNVHVRNTGKTPVRFLPSTFSCAAHGSYGGILVTKLLLTPSKEGEPLSITYQGTNHVREDRKLSADDLEYFATELKPGQTVNEQVRFTSGENRASSWQRTGASNLVPEGKYLLEAIFLVNRKESQWKGELKSGSASVEFHQKGKDAKRDEAPAN
jgi:hypothetical protein